MTDEPALEIVADDEFPFLDSNEQKTRAFILSYFANADIDGRILVVNMEAAYQWLMTGKIPPATKPTKSAI